MYRNSKKCHCLNNTYSNGKTAMEKDIMETSCNHVNTYQDMYDSCACGYEEEEDNVLPNNPMLAQSYVPYQQMDKTFKPSVGLKMGTIFPELVSPYVPCQSMAEIEYLRATNKVGKGCNQCK